MDLELLRIVSELLQIKDSIDSLREIVILIQQEVDDRQVAKNITDVVGDSLLGISARISRQIKRMDRICDSKR